MHTYAYSHNPARSPVFQDGRNKIAFCPYASTRVSLMVTSQYQPDGRNTLHEPDGHNTIFEPEGRDALREPDGHRTLSELHAPSAVCDI